MENLPALKIDPAVLDSLSLKRQLSSHDAPTLIIYGVEDSDYITEPSEALYAGMQEKGVESKLIVIPKTGHFFIGKGDQFNVHAGDFAMSELLLWFQQHLVEK